jgi:hypothetical protein
LFEGHLFTGFDLGARRRVRETQVVAFADARFSAAFSDARQKFRPHGCAHAERAVTVLAGVGLRLGRRLR